MKEFVKESGVLSIEATIVVSYLALTIMVIMNIGYVYQTENRVYHGLIQTSKTIAATSFEVNEVEATATEQAIEQINIFFENLGWKNASQKENFKRTIKNKNAPEAAKIAFANSVATGMSAAEETMKAYGLEGGMSDIDFSSSEFKDDDIKVVAKYKIKLILPVFGVESVTLQQSTLAKMWGKEEE